MITYTGRSVWPHWTEFAAVDTESGPALEDIAVGLGRQSRFAGQTREFYTVLCHSLVCGQLAEKFAPERPNVRRAALLHDAHEAIIGDIPTTWKREENRADEFALDLRIARELGVLIGSSDDQDRVKEFDVACLRAEAHVLGHAEAEKWWPKDEFGDLEALAFSLTVAQLQAGNPTRFLEPRNAIEALRRALA